MAHRRDLGDGKWIARSVSSNAENSFGGGYGGVVSTGGASADGQPAGRFEELPATQTVTSGDEPRVRRAQPERVGLVLCRLVKLLVVFRSVVPESGVADVHGNVAAEGPAAAGRD